MAVNDMTDAEIVRAVKEVLSQYEWTVELLDLIAAIVLRDGNLIKTDRAGQDVDEMCR